MTATLTLCPEELVRTARQNRSPGCAAGFESGFDIGRVTG